MTDINAQTCPACKSKMVLALPPGGSGARSFQCQACNPPPDPFKSDKAARWLEGLRPPK
jgi:hypothetical protein